MSEKSNGDERAVEVVVSEPRELALLTEQPIQEYLGKLSQEYLSEASALQAEQAELAGRELDVITARWAQDLDDRTVAFNARLERGFQDVCAFLYGWHKRFTSARGTLMVDRETSRAKIVAWDEREKQRAEEERRKLEHAQKVLAEQERQEQLKLLEKQGRADEAKALQAEPIPQPVVTLPQRPAAVKGSSVTTKLCGVVEDIGKLMAHCAQHKEHQNCFIVDQGMVDKKVQAGVALPGVKPGTKKIQRNISGRRR